MSKQMRDVIGYFDYECAAAVIARVACWKADCNRNDTHCQGAIHWIDKTLIKVVCYYYYYYVFYYFAF